MNEFQASLIAIGGVVIVGVLFYYKWREWRARKSVDSAFSNPHEDVLMGDLAQAAAQRVQHDPANASDPNGQSEPNELIAASDRNPLDTHEQPHQNDDGAAVAQAVADEPPSSSSALSAHDAVEKDLSSLLSGQSLVARSDPGAPTHAIGDNKCCVPVACSRDWQRID